jgi:hypothetical protein
MTTRIRVCRVLGQHELPHSFSWHTFLPLGVGTQIEKPMSGSCCRFFLIGV